jgi:hypothetical protein
MFIWCCKITSLCANATRRVPGVDEGIIKQDSPINASRPVATQPRSVALIAVAIKRFALGVLTFEDPTHRYGVRSSLLCMKGTFVEI